MKRTGLTGSKAFNLLEIVIVVAIIAILGAIGIPKMSQGSKGTDDSALRSDLAALRNAIDRYAAEHSGALPAVANIANQLTKYTDATGNSVSDAKTPICVYGPSPADRHEGRQQRDLRHRRQRRGLALHGSHRQDRPQHRRPEGQQGSPVHELLSEQPS